MSNKINLKREEGHPGGWIEDYGLFSDVRVWTTKRYPGWYGNIPFELIEEVKNWCEEYLQYEWSIRYSEIFIKNKKDLAIFMLRWS